jgi:hypothetical protein
VLEVFGKVVGAWKVDAEEKGRTPVKRINIEAILSDPVKRRELTIRVITATQAREGVITTYEMSDKIAVTWGARAIYTDRQIDLLPDRQSYSIPSVEKLTYSKEQKAIVNGLAAWINTKGLPFLRKQAKTLHADESRVVTLDDGQFHIEASPQASHGYLYIRAWQVRQ